MSNASYLLAPVTSRSAARLASLEPSALATVMSLARMSGALKPSIARISVPGLSFGAPDRSRVTIIRPPIQRNENGTRFLPAKSAPTVSFGWLKKLA